MSASNQQSDQVKLTHNVYELLVQEKRRRIELEEQLEAHDRLIRRFLEWDALVGLPAELPAPFADMRYWVAEFERAVSSSSFYTGGRMSGNLSGATVRIYNPAPMPERSWRSLWRKRWVVRDVVIFAGQIESGTLARGMNQPARVSVQAVDALASFQESSPE